MLFIVRKEDDATEDSVSVKKLIAATSGELVSLLISLIQTSV